MKKFLDTDHPAFKPLWTRLAVVALTVGWGLVEIITGSPFWAMIFLGLGAYCIYAFFFDFNPDGTPDKDSDPEPK